MFMFSGPITKLNFSPEINNRPAVVAEFFNRKDGKSLYNSARENKGTTFDNRPICVFPYGLTEDDNGCVLKSCSLTPIQWRQNDSARKIVFTSESAFVQVYNTQAFNPNILSKLQVYRTLYVLNKHQSDFAGQLPHEITSKTVKAVFSYDKELATVPNLMEFIMDHRLPPDLLVQNKGDEGTYIHCEYFIVST
jgi:hypothetical protein